MQAILHAERSSFFQKIIRDILRPRGFTIFNASSVAESLAIINREKIDLVITGLELDDGRGQDLIKALNASGNGKPVIVITGTESLALRQELFSLGVADFLVKQDLTDERLLAYITNLMNPDPILNALKGMRIAVLDDSRLEIQVIQAIFALHGMKNLDVYQHPSELLALKARHDLFIVDLVMPDISGEEVVKQLRELHPESIIVVCSSINNTKTVARVLDSGANDYIAKPFDAQLFMSRIKSTVRTTQLYRDLKDKQAELEKLARLDGLTGVFNHRSIINYLKEGIERHGREPAHQIGILLIDVDNFKQINDSRGHQAGDEALQALCRHIEGSLPAGAHLGRYGGEEFLLVFQGVNADEVRRNVTETLKTIAAKSIGAGDLRISYSGGLAFHGRETISELLGMADAALYEAKRSGKNRILEASGS